MTSGREGLTFPVRRTRQSRPTATVHEHGTGHDTGAAERTAALAAPDTPDAGASRQLLADARSRARERHGGTKLGAAFFGWLVAVGSSVILTAVAGAVADGLEPPRPAPGVPAVPPVTELPAVPTVPPVPAVPTVGVVAVAVLVAGYLAGGYVAGRLARFDGARNGLLAWVLGLLGTGVAAVAAATGETRFALPADATPGVTQLGGWLVVAAAVALTLGAALLGGVLGERYHRKLDRAGLPG